MSYTPSQEALERYADVLINFALGGDWGGPFEDSILPQQYLIDYVRVYKQKNASK